MDKGRVVIEFDIDASAGVDVTQPLEASDPLSTAIAELLAQIVVNKVGERAVRTMFEKSDADRTVLLELVVRLLADVHVARGHAPRGRFDGEGWRTCGLSPCSVGRERLLGVSEGRWPSGPGLAARIAVLEQELADERAAVKALVEAGREAVFEHQTNAYDQGLRDGCACAVCADLRTALAPFEWVGAQNAEGTPHTGARDVAEKSSSS